MARSTRGIRALVIAAVTLVVLGGVAWGASTLWHTAKTHLASSTCTVTARSGTSFTLDTGEASVAAEMVGAVTRFRPRLPSRAAVLVLAAGLQESHLTNLAPGDGDRDSVGVLQQRPSQGWGNGHAAVLTDVGEATREFLAALVDVPRWRTRPLAVAVQKVQISADGSLYAQHEPEAQALTDALLGLRPRGITCDFAAPTLVATTHQVATQAADQLGIDTPRARGREISVPGAGWQTVAWFVANADRLGIDHVGYDGWTFSRADGWARSRAPSQAVTATMAVLKPS